MTTMILFADILPLLFLAKYVKQSRGPGYHNTFSSFPSRLVNFGLKHFVILDKCRAATILSRVVQALRLSENPLPG